MCHGFGIKVAAKNGSALGYVGRVIREFLSYNSALIYRFEHALVMPWRIPAPTRPSGMATWKPAITYSHTMLGAQREN